MPQRPYNPSLRQVTRIDTDRCHGIYFTVEVADRSVPKEMAVAVEGITPQNNMGGFLNPKQAIQFAKALMESAEEVQQLNEGRTPAQTPKPKEVFGMSASRAMVLPREYAGNVARDLKHAKAEYSQLEWETQRLKELGLWDQIDQANLNKLNACIDEANRLIQVLQETLS